MIPLFYTIVYMKKYYVDYKQFEEVVTAEAAYFLGFLWADGHIRKAGKTSYQISIKNLASDMEVLIPVFESLGSWGISKVKITEGRKEQIQLVITDAKLGQVLDNYDFLEKSTKSSCKVLSMIPDHLKHYWFRGYFDGDGCIHLQKGKYPTISFAGNYEQDFTFIFNLLDDLDINFKHYKRILKGGSKNAVVIFSGRKNSQKFYSYIYNGKVLGLRRKRDKFEYAAQTHLNIQNRFIDYNNERRSLTEWSRITGINKKTISDRIDKWGWTLEKALTTGAK